MKPTILIPTFNRAGLVGKAIRSALDQTLECEVIVCDHGSRDETPDVVSEFGSKVTYIRRERDFGPHFCWIEGVMHASGNLIHFQYDDDWIAPDFMGRTAGMMDDEVGFAFTNAVMVDPSTGERHKPLNFMKGRLETGVHSSRLLEKRLLRGRVISPGACLFRKPELVDAIYQGRLPIADSGEYHGVGPDIFMMLLSMVRYPKFAYINEDLAFFGEHMGSITVDAQNDPERKKRFDAAYRDVGNFYRLIKNYRRRRAPFKFLKRL